MEMTIFTKNNNGGLTSVQGSLEDLSEKVERVYKILGGDLKGKEAKKKDRAKLRKDFVKLFAIRNPDKSQKEVEEEAQRLFKDAEIEEETDDSDIKFWSLENWVKYSKKWAWRKEKYGHLLGKAKEFISNKSQITAVDIQNLLNTDAGGTRWILEELITEGKITKDIESEEYNERTGEYVTKLWNVVK